MFRIRLVWSKDYAALIEVRLLSVLVY